MGDSFFNLIKSIFANPSKVGKLNDTLIVLIPRLISGEHETFHTLCDVSYKRVTKILFARLIKVMEELVDPCQCLTLSIIDNLGRILLFLKKLMTP